MHSQVIPPYLMLLVLTSVDNFNAYFVMSSGLLINDVSNEGAKTKSEKIAVRRGSVLSIKEAKSAYI